jgi:hypothetical protein
LGGESFLVGLVVRQALRREPDMVEVVEHLKGGQDRS